MFDLASSYKSDTATLSPMWDEVRKTTTAEFEAFAQAFLERLAGSQGRALSRPSQRAKSPFDFPVPRKGPYGIKKYPCGVFSRKAVADLFGQAMNGKQENRVTKGRECALKYAAGVRTRGERRYAIFERTVNDMPVAYRLAMEESRRLSIPCFRSPSKGNLVESENAPVGRFPARLWPTSSAKALTRGHRCPESDSAESEIPL
mgnify:CR=1 FL=1